MVNKWSIYENSETLRYSFDSKSIESFSELLKGFLIICEEAEISKLRIRGEKEIKYNFSEKLKLFIAFIEKLKIENGRGIYPRVSSFGVHNFGRDTFFDYIFSNELNIYNKYGEIINASITQDSLFDMLSEIRHGQMGQRGFSLPFEFETYYKIAPTREIKSYDFLIHINSDIWLENVPCIHCNQSYNNEDLRNQVGLSSIKKYWHDNTQLCHLNRVKMNSFLKGMNNFCIEVGGEMYLDNIHLYQNNIGKDKFLN